MGKTVKPPSQRGSSDDFQTPPKALKLLMPHLRPFKIIWECAEGQGLLSNALRQEGFEVIGTDLLDGHDFLMWQPECYDVIVTNPPYRFKNEFLERAYLIGKPFALLLPLTTFETKRRQRLFRDFGVEVIFLPDRINFLTPSGQGTGAWFAVAWFTWGLNIGKQLNFPDGRR